MLLMTNKQDLAVRSKLFRGFSDLSRMAIIEALRDGPLTVSEIVATTGLSQSNASQHLMCLRECGLVNSQQQWRHVRYQLADERVASLLQLADELLADVAQGVSVCENYNTDPEA